MKWTASQYTSRRSWFAKGPSGSGWKKGSAWNSSVTFCASKLSQPACCAVSAVARSSFSAVVPRQKQRPPSFVSFRSAANTSLETFGSNGPHKPRL